MRNEDIVEKVRQKFDRLSSVLDERGRRVWAGQRADSTDRERDGCQHRPHHFWLCRGRMGDLVAAIRDAKSNGDWPALWVPHTRHSAEAWPVFLPDKLEVTDVFDFQPIDLHARKLAFTLALTSHHGCQWPCYVYSIERSSHCCN